MKYMILALSMLFSAFSHPGSIANTKVVGMYCGYYGGQNMCSIYFSEPVNEAPSCHTTGSNRMQIKGDDEMGKAILSLAMMAYSQGKEVSAGGKGSCTVHHNTEDLNTLFILPSTGTP